MLFTGAPVLSPVGVGELMDRCPGGNGRSWWVRLVDGTERPFRESELVRLVPAA